VRKLTKLQLFEFCVRLIAWVGVALFGLFSALRMIQIFPEDAVATVFVWIFFFAIFITGFFDLRRFVDRIKAS
jgi:hypothetical protein